MFKVVFFTLFIYLSIFSSSISAQTVECDPSSGKNCFSCGWLQDTCGVSLVDQYCLDGYAPDQSLCSGLKEKDKCEDIEIMTCKPLSICSEPSSCYIWDGTTETGCPYGYKRSAESFCANTELICCTSEVFDQSEGFESIIQSQKVNSSELYKDKMLSILSSPITHSVLLLLAVIGVAIYIKHKEH